MQKLAQILDSFGLATDQLSNEFLTWCLDLGMAPGVLRQLSQGWVAYSTEPFATAAVRLRDAEGIQEDHQRKPQYHRDGILAIGSCMNGDEIGLDLQSGEVRYLSHEHLWAPGDHDTREWSVVVAASLEDFAEQAQSEALPHDYWSAGRATTS